MLVAAMFMISAVGAVAVVRRESLGLRSLPLLGAAAASLVAAEASGRRFVAASFTLLGVTALAALVVIITRDRRRPAR